MNCLRRRERFLLYGICGFAVEVFFTAIWEAIENGNRKMHGLTSAYAFLIYGLSALVQESLYLLLKDHMSLWLRGFIYLSWSLSWEFTTGVILKQFDACPWDYAAYFRGHFMGVITAEYIPLWYLACILGERFIIKNVLHLSWLYPTAEKQLK
uniref:Transmembrane protein 229B n=2 Tax=Ascaris TaxID=6251 RepID=F1L694_ASCSU